MPPPITMVGDAALPAPLASAAMKASALPRFGVEVGRAADAEAGVAGERSAARKRLN